jgi:hypothetical protein
MFSFAVVPPEKCNIKIKNIPSKTKNMFTGLIEKYSFVFTKLTMTSPKKKKCVGIGYFEREISKKRAIPNIPTKTPVPTGISTFRDFEFP